MTHLSDAPTTDLDRWLHEIMAMTGLKEAQAERVFVSVSDALASQLPASEVRGLRDQLPLSVRQCLDRDVGEVSVRARAGLVAQVRESCPSLDLQHVERGIWAVLTVLSHHLSPVWVRHARSLLPVELRAMWNTAA